MRKFVMGAALLAVAACGEKQPEATAEEAVTEEAAPVVEEVVHDTTHVDGDSADTEEAPESTS